MTRTRRRRSREKNWMRVCLKGKKRECSIGLTHNGSISRKWVNYTRPFSHRVRVFLFLYSYSKLSHQQNNWIWWVKKTEEQIKKMFLFLLNISVIEYIYNARIRFSDSFTIRSSSYRDLKRRRKEKKSSVQMLLFIFSLKSWFQCGYNIGVWHIYWREMEK